MNMNTEDLRCPVCSEFNPEIEHPQPFQDSAGRWLCGTCWFKHHQASIMQIRQQKENNSQ